MHGLLGEHSEAASWWARWGQGSQRTARERLEALIEQATALREGADASAELALIEGTPRVRDAELDYRLTRERASCLQATGDYGGARQIAESWLATSGGEAPADRLAAIQIVLANCEWQTGQHAQAASRCSRLLEALPPEQIRARASAHTTRGTALWRMGQVQEAAEALGRGAQLFEDAGSLLDAARVSNNLGILRYSEGDWSGAIAAFERFRSQVARMGNEGEVASAANNLGVLYRDTGQLDRARAAFAQALELARRLDLARLEPMVLGNLAEAEAIGGRGADAERLYAEAIALSDARGILDEQAECWRRVVQRRLDDREMDRLGEAIRKARAAADAADAAGEHQLLDALEAITDVRMHDLETGLIAAEAAIDALLEVGNSHEVARMRLRLAEALADHGRLADAGELLDMAEATFRELQARPELMRLEPVRQSVVAAERNRYDLVASHYAALQQLTLELSRQTSLDDLLDTLLERTLGLVGFERGYVLLLDESGEALVRSNGSLTTQEIDLAVHGPSTSVTQRVLRSRRPLVALDIDEDSSLGSSASITAARLRSVVCVPIVRGQELLGVIYVDSRAVLRGAAQEKVSLLGAVADAASVAIENARLVDALRRKNDSLAILAHELRTPLSAMIGLASLVLNGDGDSTEQVGQIKAQGERLSRMIDQVLSVARMEAGKADWERSVVDPLELVVRARDTMEPLAIQAGITLGADITDDAPEILGDVDRLTQVLVNLMGNAVKFAPAGGRVWINARRTPDDALELVVEDDGPGIPEDRLAAIFEPYEQAGDSSMRRRGVGLGLAISRRIVVEHGGALTARNRAEGGARFVVRLPNADEASVPRRGRS